MIVCCAAGLLAGNLAFLWLCTEPPPLWVLLGVTAAGVVSAFCPRFAPWDPAARVFLSALAFSFVWTAYAVADRLGDRLQADLEGLDVEATIRVASIPAQQGFVIRFDADVLASDVTLPDRIRLRWYNSKHKLHLGDRLTVLVRLKQPRGFVNPGGFDYERYLFHKRIGASGYIRHLYSTQKSTSWKEIGDRGRGRVFELLSERIGKTDNKGPVLALAMGERGAMKEHHWRQLRMTGTSHLFAISGMHIALVYGFVFFFATWLWRWTFLPLKAWPAQKFAALAALLPAIAYAWLAGFSLPTQRALLMLGLIVVVVLNGRTITLPQGIAFAAGIVVCLDLSLIHI